MKFENPFMEAKLISQDLQIKLLKGEIKWDSDKIQLFIPIILSFTDFAWLKMIAEHDLVEEDEVIVKNFLERVEALCNVNQNRLHTEGLEAMKRKFKK